MVDFVVILVFFAVAFLTLCVLFSAAAFFLDADGRLFFAAILVGFVFGVLFLALAGFVADFFAIKSCPPEKSSIQCRMISSTTGGCLSPLIYKIYMLNGHSQAQTGIYLSDNHANRCF
jgi:hypothetical protein